MIYSNTKCPVCGAKPAKTVLSRLSMPVMQNYVYASRKKALSAPCAPFKLMACLSCGFTYNGAFKPELLTYDEHYDNRVPSPVFEAYYQEIAEYVQTKYIPNDGLVVDIGCGKGHFLEVLCDKNKKLQGIGIDPSLEKEGKKGKLLWVREPFNKSQLSQKPALVICRHVLEHIPSPVEFLTMIREGLSDYKSVSCFFEVPDFEWIIKNNAFWDVCYEHCNYFTKDSIRTALVCAGFKVKKVTSAFKGQYLWIEAETHKPIQTVNKIKSNSKLTSSILAFGKQEKKFVLDTKKKLAVLKKNNNAIAIWGMATKGVVYSLLADRENKLIDYCVDVNNNKQNCYIPVSGAKIVEPQALVKEKRDLAIIVMNPNYTKEIKNRCVEMGIRAKFEYPYP